MANKIVDVVVERMPLIATAVAVSLLAVLVQTILKKDHLANLPLIGAEHGDLKKRRDAYTTNAKSLYLEGYKKFKNGIFTITSQNHAPNVVVAKEFLPELKNLPEDVLSHLAAIREALESKYTRLDADQPHAIHTIRSRLTPGLPRFNPSLADEVAKAFRKELPRCQDWTEVNINQKLLRIVAAVSGRVFIGEELCNEEVYINASVNYTVDLMGAARAIKNLPRWQRWFRAPSLPEVKKMNKHEQDATRFLRPIIVARQQAANEPGYQKPDDMLQWYLDGIKNVSLVYLAKLQLSTSFAAIHTTTMTATNAFYNLAANPDLIPVLREEIQTLLAENGNKFTSPALAKMKKLDSFLKETIRLHPNGWGSFHRKVLKPFTLSNGQKIPAGVTLEVPQGGINFDPEIFPDPEKFDGLRFYRMREGSNALRKAGKMGKSAASVEAHSQFVSVSETNLHFGYGKHACPGRFFAANEIKMIFARALLTYDIRNVGHTTERYPNFEFADQCIPDPTKSLLFKEI